MTASGVPDGPVVTVPDRLVVPGWLAPLAGALLDPARVDPSGIVVLNSLPPVHVAVSGFDVTAVVAWWRSPSAVRAVDPREAAALHLIAVAELADPAHRVQVRHPSGYTGPAFEVRGLLIWGLTAHLIDGVLELAGWQRPWDRQRVASIPERYLTDRRGGDRSPGGPDAH